MSQVIKGGGFKIKSTVYSEPNVVQNIVGASIIAMFKKQPNDLDVDKLFNATVNITDGANGECESVITAAQTNSLSYPKVYFELLVKLVSGDHIRSGIQEIDLKQNLIKTLN